MKTYPDCIPCFLRQTLTTARRAGADDAVAHRALQEVLALLRAADLSEPPARHARAIYPAVYRLVGEDDPFAALKQRYNRLAVALLPRLRRETEAADDPFRAAVKLALAGNIIDFGAGREEDIDLASQIVEITRREPAVDQIAQLHERLNRARRVLYIADNAGEIVLDRLLIEQLPPAAHVQLVVRGAPIINDVTRADLASAEIPSTLDVIDTGQALPGVWLAEAGAEFLRAYEAADVIVAKGQGNFETLHESEGPPLFFLFMVKCDVVVRRTGLALGDTVVAARGSDALAHR